MIKPPKIKTAQKSDENNKKIATKEILSLTPRMNTNDNWEILHDSVPRSASTITIGNESYKVGVRDLDSTRITMGLHEYFYDSSKRLALNNNYLCYPVKDNSNRVGSIRVINRNNNRRALIPAHSDTILDLGFNSEEDDLLVSVSIDGILNLWIIMEIKGEIRHGLTFSVKYTGSLGCDLKNSPNQEKNEKENGNENKNKNKSHNENKKENEKEKENKKEKENEKKKDQEKKGYFTKVVWDSRRQNILATITTDNTIIVWNVLQYLSNTSEKIQVFESSKVKNGAYFLSGHTKKILDLAFEPNKKILASTGEDGALQIWDYRQQKCLKKIIPHDGAPVNSIIYCGNPLKMNQESFDKELSKFALTGGKNNSEIKLWEIENWKCLQTIKILPPLKTIERTKKWEFAFQMYLDATSQFIILADTLGQFVYVLHLNINFLKQGKLKIQKKQDSDNTNNTNNNSNNNENNGSKPQLVDKEGGSRGGEIKELEINFDYLTKFYVSQPTYSLILENIKNQKKTSLNNFPFDINMFCITSTSIEQYVLKSELIDLEEIKNSLNNKEQIIAQFFKSLENNNTNLEDRSESKKEKLNNSNSNSDDEKHNNKNKLNKEEKKSNNNQISNSRINKLTNGEDKESDNNNNSKIKNNNNKMEVGMGVDESYQDNTEKNNETLFKKKKDPNLKKNKVNKKKFKNVWAKSKKKKKTKKENDSKKDNGNTKNLKEERTNIRIKGNSNIKEKEIINMTKNDNKKENGEENKNEKICQVKEKKKSEEKENVKQNQNQKEKVRGEKKGESKILKFQLEKILHNFEKNMIEKTNNKMKQIKENQNNFIEEKIQKVETDNLLNSVETTIKQWIKTIFKKDAFNELQLFLQSIPKIERNHLQKNEEIEKGMEILLNNNYFISEILKKIIQNFSIELIKKIEMMCNNGTNSCDNGGGGNLNIINYEKLEKKIKGKLLKKFNFKLSTQSLFKNIKNPQKGSLKPQNHKQLFTILEEQWNAFNLQINEKLDHMKLKIYQHLETMTTFWDETKGISQFLLDVEMYNQALAVVFQSDQKYEEKEQLIVWCLNELEKRGVFHSQILSFDLIIIDLLFNFCSVDLDSQSEKYFEIKTRILLNIILKLDQEVIGQLLPRLEKLIQKLDLQYEKIIKGNYKKATELKKLIFIIKSKQKFQRKINKNL
ncbi:enhancer of mRNA-decapping protein [Anaeramoeba flamelloides]|uniref:Enhancer of mRNA-decapping protein n=1 Tax=Anaeramoeba flamelloides TaxID=1746091 RepID=A0ABQ8XBL3_9EUKA|nr:enhancer of mRNA-decapping protein [Anaeramoeba flamelloides]